MLEIARAESEANHREVRELLVERKHSLVCIRRPRAACFSPAIQAKPPAAGPFIA
jgi:hypothetical protein